MMGYRLIITGFLVLISSFPVFSKGFMYRACYKGYFFFIPVIKNCIEYTENEKTGFFKTDVETVGILKIFKNVHYTGISVMENQNSKRFEFIQKEKNLKVFYRYIFYKGYVKTEKRKKEGKKVFIDKKVVPLDSKYQDVFTASVQMFKSLKKTKKGKIFVFYDNKTYSIPYKREKEEIIKIGRKKYSVYRVILKPRIKGEGLIKTKGNWILWIDKHTGFPVKVKAVFDKGIMYLKRSSFEYKEF